MKVLTLRQPWPYAIASGLKNVELRHQLFSHRGPLAIHSGKEIADREAFKFVDARLAEAGKPPMPDLGAPGCPTELAMGAVIAVVNVTSGHFHSDCNGTCSPWAMPGYRGHHMLADTRVLRRPVPTCGKQGMWTADEDLAAEIRKQLP